VLAPACFDEGVRGLSPFSKFWVGIRKATVPHLIAAVRVFDGAARGWLRTWLRTASNQPPRRASSKKRLTIQFIKLSQEWDSLARLRPFVNSLRNPGQRCLSSCATSGGTSDAFSNAGRAQYANASQSIRRETAWANFSGLTLFADEWRLRSFEDRRLVLPGQSGS
jgi:hypothetical protein